MKKLLLGCLILTGIVIIAGCSQTGTSSTGGGKEYYPDTVGYKWTYRGTVSSSTLEAGTTITITGTAVVGSVEVKQARTEYSYGGSLSTSESYLRVTDVAAYSYGSPTAPTTEPTAFIVFPLEIGRKWTAGSGSSLITYEVVAKETVSVPAGNFNNCYKLSFPQVFPLYTYANYVWLAPNVGLIKGAYFIISGEVVTATSTIELISKNF